MLEPSSVLWFSHHGQVPKTVSPCTSAVGMHVLSGVRAHLGRSLAETIISAKYLPEGICYEKVLCDFGVIFIELLLWGNAAIPVLGS